MATVPERKAGTGWIVYAGVMLLIVGFLDIINGLWAIDNANKLNKDLLYAEKLGGWGWFYLILGIIVALAGIGVFVRSQAARWTGIAVASFAVVANMLWVFQFPIASLIIMLLASLVVYGLVVYGEREIY